jgi:hypothetical protein
MSVAIHSAAIPICQRTFRIRRAVLGASRRVYHIRRLSEVTLNAERRTPNAERVYIGTGQLAIPTQRQYSMHTKHVTR